MLSPAAVSSLEEILDSKTSSDALFTCYDVTKEVRALGHWAEHKDIRHAVYNRMNSNSDYTHTACLVAPSAYAEVFYNPSVSDVSEYGVSLDPSAVTISAVTTKPVVTSNTLIVDAQNRVRLGANTLRSLGLGPNNFVNVWFQNDTILVSPDADVSTSSPDKDLTIDQHTNVRIKLPDAFTASSYSMSLNTADNFVTLSPL